jgi:hypothetical protein
MNKLLFVVFASLLWLQIPVRGASPVVISEFMAFNVTNTAGLRDDFGEYSDWIEIRNVTTTNVNLLNWGLTDSRGDATPWRFPATNLSGGGFMVVFATGRDRAVPGAALHTDFRLSGDGEYLALLDPDGNIATEFAPQFPSQVANVSYGFGLLSSNITLVASNGPGRVRIPSDGSEGTNWTYPAYNDSAWTAAINGIGFGGVPGLNTDVGAAMSNVNASAYVRLPFTVGDPLDLAQLILRIRYDDGLVVWVNGVEVARVNAPDSLDFNSAATNAHAPTSFEEIRLGVGMLNAGANVLAIQGLNQGAANNDFLIQAELIGLTVLVDSPTPGYFFVPTPGLPNTGASTNLGPIIAEVQHSPNVPRDDEDLVVTARVTPTFNAVTNVTLRYRIMFGETNSAVMLDDGLHGDGAAGDGVYGATISSALSTNGQMIRYFVRATDDKGTTSRWPLFTSAAETAEYLGTIVDPTNVTSQLPIFHLFSTALQAGPPTSQTGADSESGGRVAIFYDGEFYDNVYMELRGNTSAGQQKKSHRLEFNREHPFRHLPEFPRVRKTSLMAEFLDPVYIRQHLCFWLLQEMGVPSPFFYPVRAQLNGSFYALVFHNDVIDEEQVGRMGYDSAGALYKAAGNCLPSESSTGVFQKKSPKPLTDHTDYQTLVRAINETNTVGRRAAAYDMLDIPEVVNYLAGARWCAENDDVWANMSIYRDTFGDGMWRIVPFDMNASWGQRYGGITPLDAIADTCKSHPLYGGATIIACDGSSYNRIYDVIIANPDLRQMLLRRERTVLDRWVLEPGVAPQSRLLETHIRYMTNLIWTEAFLDRAKWGFSTWTASNRYLTNAANELFNEFINLRRIHFSVTHNITNVAKPIGITPASNAGIPQSQPTNAQILITTVEYNPASANQAQEYFCVTNPNPYALDISGWKVGGGVDFTFKQGTIMPSNSVLYVSPDVKAFRARAVSPRGGQGLFVVGPYKGQLSARGETLYIVDDRGRGVSTNTYAGNPSLAQQYLRITEIMYNPAPLPGNTNDAQVFEYIELKNISTNGTTLDLTNVKLVNGVEFNFTGSAITSLAPGQRVLVVKNAAAFAARYGGGRPVAGVYSGNLENGGERIQLLDAVNEEILDFDYENDWYPITDGAGFSLAIVDEFADPDLWDSKTNWRPSGQENGAPGEVDPPLPPIPAIVINEILTHTDLPLVDTVELLNPTGGDVNLGGWFLTDDFGTPKKFRIPNTNLVAGGYLLFDESQFNTPTNAPTSFALSSTGDEIYLFSGDGTNLTGYVQGYSFGAAANGVSFGRYTNSQTNVHFVAQSALTLGGPNAGPKVGPIVVSEIYYHPPDLAGPRGPSDNDLDEYIELRNISGAAVALYDPLHPQNTWRLRDAVKFTFPTGVNIPAGGFILVVGFKPNNGPALDTFRSVNNVTPGTPIYGPWDGKLDNSKDNVELVRPDLPDPADGTVPYILVDKIDYEDSAPWPTNNVDGQGLSLQRINTAAYGNDPANWQAGSRTPGSPAPTGVTSAPAIITQPADVISSENYGATFNVTASGSTPLTYQWYFNGTVLRLANSPSLALNNLRVDQAGTYSCRILNGAGAADSRLANLTVRTLPRITQQPTNRAVWIRPDPRAVATPEGTNVTFIIAVTSAYPPLTYQWSFNGTNLPSATNASITITNVQVAHEGDYVCALTDAAGTATSATAHLTPLIQPIIVQPPLSQTVVEGSDFSHSVEIIGNPVPFAYSWRRAIPSGTIISNYGNFRSNFITLNSTAAGLVLANGITSSNYELRLVIFNEANLSPGVLVRFTNTVVADFDRDGIPDTVENSLGLSPTDPADGNGDLDGDGMSNRAEYIAGTDPADPASYLKITSLTAGGGATLTFGAISNKTYTIQYTERVGSGSWSKLKDVGAARTNRTETVFDPAFTTNRYYRIATPFVP